MEIKHKGFTLTPGNGVYTWDMHQTVDVVARTKEMAIKHNVKIGDKTGTQREELIGYDYRFESALRVMIDVLIAQKEGTFNITQVLVAYVKEKQELVEYIKKALAVKV